MIYQNVGNGKAIALELREEFSHLNSAQEIFDHARSEERFINENDALIVWGRLFKLMMSENN